MTVPLRTGHFFPGRGKTSKGKFGCLSSLRLFPLPPSTPPLDSAAHHIATRQIRASCSISTVPTLVNSAIMGAEKDGSPAVPLRTAQTLNSTVVWAVSEAPNISRPFTNRLGRGARYTLRSCSAYLSRKQHLGGSTNRRATRKGWAGLGWAGLDWTWVTCSSFVWSLQGGEVLHRLLVDADVLCAVASHSSLSCGHGSLVTRSTVVDLSQGWAAPRAKWES